MTLFVCTAGTSIAGVPMKDGETAASYRRRIDDKIAGDRATTRRANDFLVKASAELNALVRRGCDEKDEVAYLLSETDDGAICGERLVSLTRSALGSRARSVVVNGLQVRDERRFRQIGVRSLFYEIDRLRSDTMEADVELNGTGGFKSMVPYLTLYGMFHDLPVFYIFERSDSLIRLPRIPLAFDWRRLAPAAKAVVALARDLLPEHEWRTLIPPDYWDPMAKADYDCLFEHEDGLVGLSAVGLLMKSKLEAASDESEVLLSPQAMAALDAAEQEVRAHYEFMLARVRNPLLRESARHSESLRKTDLRVWKRYGPSGPRMLYWPQGSRVMVGELMQHDAYEDYVDGSPRHRADYPTDGFSAWSGAASLDWETALDELLSEDRGPEQPA